jgi:hypothetical protein
MTSADVTIRRATPADATVVAATAREIRRGDLQQSIRSRSGMSATPVPGPPTRPAASVPGTTFPVWSNGSA